MKKIIALFQTIHYVIKAEKICKKADIEYRIKPVPTSISSDCGMCIEIDEEKKEILESELKNNSILVRFVDAV